MRPSSKRCYTNQKRKKQSIWQRNRFIDPYKIKCHKFYCKTMFQRKILRTLLYNSE